MGGFGVMGFWRGKYEYLAAGCSGWEVQHVDTIWGRARGGAGSYLRRVWRGVLVLGDGRGQIYCPVRIAQCSSKFTSSSPQAHPSSPPSLRPQATKHGVDTDSASWYASLHSVRQPSLSSQLFATTHRLPPSPPSPPSPADNGASMGLPLAGLIAYCSRRRLIGGRKEGGSSSAPKRV
jgi:hypothetical protein